MKKNKICYCKGEDINCPICKGTGIIIYDESFDNIHDIYSDEDTYYDSLDEVDDE